MYREEFLNFLRGSIIDLGLTRIERPRFDDKVFDDPHAHYPQPKDKKDLEKILGLMLENVDRTALTTWGHVKRVLSYQNLVDAVKCLDNYQIDNRGVVSIIKHKDRQLEVYPSQEIITKSHLHITAEGCETLIPENLDPRKTIDLIHRQNGIAIIEHPCTKAHPIFQFVITNEEDNTLTKEVLEMADAAEIFNSYNTLWMFISNARAKRLVRDITAPIAGSDIHYGDNSWLARLFYFRNIGMSGIYLPRHDLTSLAGREIIELKRKDLKERKYTRFENYTGPLTFFATMVPQRVKRKLGIDKDSTS